MRGSPRLVNETVLRNVWVSVARSFGAAYTPEGFKMTNRPYELPKNASALDLPLKRTVTICNLFANEHHTINHIARILDLEANQVISCLIETGLIVDRRQKTKRITRERRVSPDRYHISTTLVTGMKVHELLTLCGAKSDNFVSSQFVLHTLVNDSELCEECLDIYRKRSGLVHK